MDQIFAVLVRVLTVQQMPQGQAGAMGRKTVGTGFFLSKTHWATCAHVVCDALGLDREEVDAPKDPVPFAVSRAAAGSGMRWAKIIAWKPALPQAELGDIAILEEVITEENSTSGADASTFKAAGRMVHAGDCQGHPFVSYGFPLTVNDDAVPADGLLKLPRGSGWITVEAKSAVGEFVEGGYSGAPVWDETVRGIVGMIVLAKEKNRSAAMIPISHLVLAWPSLGNLVKYPSPLSLRRGAPATAEEVIVGNRKGHADVIGKLLDEVEPADLVENREEETAFLKELEDFIGGQLGRSADQHFIELSMKLAASQGATDEGFQRNLSFAFLLDDVHVSQHVIPGLNQLQATLQQKRSMVMLAPPGSGKTTVMQHLALRLIGEYRRQNSWLLPVFVPLTQYSLDPRTAAPIPILDFLKGWVVKLVGERHFVAVQFDKLVQKGRFVFILDGLEGIS